MKTIGIEKIDLADRRFCISHRFHDPLLLKSVARFGILQPVMLTGVAPYTIVQGFRRVASARDLGLEEVPFLLIETDAKNALLGQIHDNARRLTNVVEKANAVNAMVRHGFSKDEIYVVMNLLGLNPHEMTLNILVDIAVLEEPLKEFLYARDVSLKNAKRFLRFSPDERAQIIDILSSFHVTEGYLRDILDMMQLAKIKQGEVDFSEMQGAQDSVELKERLKMVVYPVLTSLRDELSSIRRQCKLPPNVDIKVDPFFEKEYIDIIVRIRNDQELRGSMKILDKCLEDGFVRRILELING